MVDTANGPLRDGGGVPAPVTLLGVPIHPLRLHELLDIVRGAVRCGRRITIMYVNIHCMNVSYADPTYRAILGSASVVYCDGTGVKLAARLLGLTIPERMTGADWIHNLCRLALREGLSLYLLGSEPGVARSAARRLLAAYPGLRIVGTHDGYDRSPGVIAEINASRPDIVLVGMGTPAQERWIAAHRAAIDAPVVWGVGALFNFVAGTIPRGPRWMTEHGLEWLARLAVEPGKLWRRYLIGNPRFLWRVLHERWRRGGRY